MRGFNGFRFAGALVACAAFVMASAEPVLCAAAHHAEAPAAMPSHHAHGMPPHHGGSGLREASSHACHDWTACCVSASGIAAPVALVQVTAARRVATSPTDPPRLISASFAPTTPPPRA